MEKKQVIKNILREGSEKNSLGAVVTKPTQELVIMRGIPGSGKSTKAKSLVGDGIIHSTDDVIEASGDYREFFAKMIANKDFAPLSRAHSQNFKNAKASMEKGISPIIIDNTNLKADEAKNYIETALQMGYSEKNIKFVDVGDGGLSAEELAKRNTHGVPLDKIKQMIQTYKSVGPLTLEKVLGSKSRFGNNVSKIAMVVLDDSSKSKLLTALGHNIPKGWEILAHHMTISFGKGLSSDLVNDLGKTVNLKVVAVGKSDMVIAAGVEGYHSDNKHPHITLAVNRASGGKPVMSNQITDWKTLPSYINVSGVVTEEKLG